MPEGPEIRRAADQISSVLTGKAATSIQFGLDRLQQFETKLTGEKITSIETRGKAILTHFGNGLTIYSHNQLYGRWVTLRTGETSESKRQLRIRIETIRGSALLYSASEIEVLTKTGIDTHPFLSKLGPDLFDPSLTIDAIEERLLSPKFHNRQLGSFLTDQSFVAGLGNYLRCEILFLTQLLPSSKPRHCSKEQIHHLAKQVLDLPSQSYQTGGITYLPDRAETLMNAGQSKESSRFWIFRRNGLPCRICQTTIEKENHNGQPCYLCPNCQQPQTPGLT